MEIFCLAAFHFENYPLHLPFRKNDSEAVTEIFARVEGGVGIECLLQDAQIVDAVQGVGLDFSVGRYESGHIPPLAENLQEVGLQNHSPKKILRKHKTKIENFY